MSAIKEVANELQAARAIFPNMHSFHEGFAILDEEVDELWEEVKKKPEERDKQKLRKEAMQVAAMAIRFMEDLTS